MSARATCPAGAAAAVGDPRLGQETQTGLDERSGGGREGGVALLVGAVGVANIMVISVLERRSEIGLRRVLGATEGQIRVQFLAEVIGVVRRRHTPDFPESVRVAN